MTEKHDAACSWTSRIIAAPLEALYAAFMDPVALAAWLPPGEMAGRVHEFDARVGGGYRMSLFYLPAITMRAARHPAGKIASTSGLSNWRRRTGSSKPSGSSVTIRPTPVR